ncbi:MAG: UDP-N-acetylmuramate dehydrogenase [Mangrovimonas sp.]|nr:UDP-N-acetylmuramate dehydrogenase [Mangrovimonas sp.]
MQVLQNISLKNYNTFGIDVNAQQFVSVSSIDELKWVLAEYKSADKLFLGGGSNMLLTKPINGLVIHLNIKGKSVVFENENRVQVKGFAGENWHEFVLWCIEQGFGGIENLSLIPGNLGSAPIQNIGAYGVELKDVMVSCDVLDLRDFSVKTLTNEECQFGYRESIFKQQEKGNFIVLSVILELTKSNHNLHTSYGAIQEELEKMGVSNPSIKNISTAVINIRRSKLPDPKDLGNSGSFFKNPVIASEKYQALKVVFPDMPQYPVSENEVKVPAGWLIEKAGFKGKTLGNYGVHKKQALVLVNYGGASGSDILNLARLIQKTVVRIFGIAIETEVNIL